MMLFASVNFFLILLFTLFSQQIIIEKISTLNKALHQKACSTISATLSQTTAATSVVLTNRSVLTPELDTHLKRVLLHHSSSVKVFAAPSGYGKTVALYHIAQTLVNEGYFSKGIFINTDKSMYEYRQLSDWLSHHLGQKITGGLSHLVPHQRVSN